MTGLAKNTLMGTSGDVSDMQHMIKTLANHRIREECLNDGHAMSPKQWHTAISTYQYQKRSDMNPLWNAHLIGGIDVHSGRVFLGYSDLLGTTYEENEIATGFGGYLARPLMRSALEAKGGPENLSEEEAVRVLEECLRVLYYRDARSLDKVQFGKVTKQEGVVISAPYQLTSDWSVA